MRSEPHPHDFLSVYERHFDEVWRYVKARVIHPQDAEDLTSEIFLRAFKAWRRYDPQKATVRTWLFAITRNVLIDRWRKRGDEPLDVDHLSLMEPDADPEEENLKRDVLDCITRNLKNLRDREREALAMRFGTELTHDEIGSLLGMNVGAVKMLIHRAVRKLREACI